MATRVQSVAVSAPEDVDDVAKEERKVLADAFVHPDLRQFDLIVPEHDRNGVAAGLALEKENIERNRVNRHVEAQNVE
jgi:hypothetical protein